MAFEEIHAVWDLYDGIRSGVADFGGVPHHFKCEFDTDKGDYSDTFVLTPLDDKTIALVREQNAIWEDWEIRFLKGEVLQSTHPALPGQNARFIELQVTLDQRILERSDQTFRARGKFRPLPNQSEKPKGMVRDMEVEWDYVPPKITG